MNKREELVRFLSDLDLDAYLEKLLDEGFEDVDTLRELSEEELTRLGFKLGHRKKLLKAMREAGSPQLPPAIERAIATYPYPIALPLQDYAKDPTGNGKRLAVKDAFVGLIKFQGLLLLTEYLRSKHADEELTRMISKNLARPLESSWVGFTEKAAPFLLSKGHQLFVRELWPCYEAAKTKKVKLPGSGYINDDGHKIETKARLGLFEALLAFRNKVAHKPRRLEEKALEEAAYFLNVLGQLLDELSWLGDYTLYLRDDGIVWRMAGVLPVPCELDWPSDAPARGLLLASPRGDTNLSVFPLFLAPRAFVEQVDDHLDMLVYATDTGKRLSYVSPKGDDHEIEAVHRDWSRWLEEKQVFLETLATSSLTPEEIGRRARRVTGNTEDALIASRKVLDGVYVERGQAESHLELYPKSTFPLSLVTAQAGSGKTSLLHHLAGVWGKQGMSVVLVRANAIEGADVMAWLRGALRLADEVDAAALAKQGAAQDRPLVLVIDGLNEHAQRTALLESILQVAEATRGEGYLRIQLSWRSEHAEWAKAADDKSMLFYPAPDDAADSAQTPSLHLAPWRPDEVSRLWDRLAVTPWRTGEVSQLWDRLVKTESEHAGWTDAVDAKSMSSCPAPSDAADSARTPSLHLTPWLPDEVVQLWNRLAESDEQRFKPLFNYDDLREKSPAVAEVLSNPLWLRIFLEVYAGQEMPASPSRRALQQAWYEKLGRRTRDSNRLLLDLARSCMEQQAQALDLDSLYDDPRTKKAMRRTDVAAPFHKLEGKEGVLARLKGSRTDVVFTMDRFLEQVAGQALVLDGAARTPGDLLAAHERLQGWSLADEAVRNALEIKLGEQPDFLWGLIDEGKERASLLAGEALARRIQETREPQDVADRLMLVASEGDLHAAREAAERLERVLEFDLQTAFVGAVVWAIPAEETPTVAEMELRRIWVRALRRAKSPELAREADVVKRRTEAASSVEVAMMGLEIRALVEKWGHKNEGAILLFHELLRKQVDFYGPGSHEEANTKAELGGLYQRQRMWDEARDCLEHALAIERALDPCDPIKVVLLISQLGWLLQQKGELQQALRLWQEALRVQRQVFGESHPEVAESLSAIGSVYLAMGEHDRGLDHRKQALNMFEQVYGRDHPRILDEWVYIARAHQDRSDYGAKQSCLEQARAILERLPGDWSRQLEVLDKEIKWRRPHQKTANWCPRRLTKSLFVRGAWCARKLFYGGQPEVYPKQETSDYVQALAEGGYQIGELAKVLQGPGEPVGDLREDVAVAQTKALMERDEVTIFEGAFCAPDDNLLIRADVLHKRGNSLRLLEVKAKSWDPREDRFFTKAGGFLWKWEPYLLDIAFQHYVLERCYPEASIESFLLFIDKNAVSDVTGLHQRFLATRVVDPHTNQLRLACEDRGHPEAAPILVEVPVRKAVDYVRTKWRDATGRSFGELVQELASVCRDGRKPEPELGSKCKDCEFRVSPEDLPEGGKSGFLQCWSERWGVSPGEVAAQPLGLDLWNNRRLFDQLEQDKWRLRDLAADMPWSGLAPVDTESRHAVQVHVGAGLRPGPYVDAAGLRDRLAAVHHPLHLIDFETASAAIPFVAGRRPYEVHAFQFSHHVLHEDGRLEHRGEWLEDEVGAFPNYRFLRALRESLGTCSGTFVHYAPHENSVLNQLRRQLLDDPSPPDNRDELVAFVEHWAKPTMNEGGWTPPGQMLDLAVWVRDTFYDASMRGSYSIKAVLPAVLRTSEVLEQRFGAPVYGVEGGMSSSNFEAKQWFERDSDGTVKDPYDLLPPVFEGDAELSAAERIFGQVELREGGSASTAYARLQFEQMSDAERAAIRAALLRYCELDTLAMAMVFEHLRWLAAR